jgi:hypothetical protein
MHGAAHTAAGIYILFAESMQFVVQLAHELPALQAFLVEKRPDTWVADPFRGLAESILAIAT